MRSHHKATVTTIQLDEETNRLLDQLRWTMRLAKVAVIRQLVRDQIARVAVVQEVMSA